MGSKVSRQRPRIDPGDGRDPGSTKQRSELERVVNHGRGCIGHHEATEPWSNGLVIGHETSVVADQRVRHDHDLTGV